MAISNAVAVGRARKSLGDITYRRVRGRTIVSQRVTSNASNSPKQRRVRAGFGMITSIQGELSSVIDASFNPTRFGSRKNAFFKANDALRIAFYDTELLEGYEGFMQEGASPLYFWLHVQKNQVDYPSWVMPPLRLGAGGLDASIELSRTSGLLVPRITLSRAFRPGDVVNIFVTRNQIVKGVHTCVTYSIPYVVPSSVAPDTFVLTVDNTLAPRLTTVVSEASAVYAISVVVRSGTATSIAQHSLVDITTLPPAFAGEPGTSEPGDI